MVQEEETLAAAKAALLAEVAASPNNPNGEKRRKRRRGRRRPRTRLPDNGTVDDDASSSEQVVEYVKEDVDKVVETAKDKFSKEEIGEMIDVLRKFEGRGVEGEDLEVEAEDMAEEEGRQQQASTKEKRPDANGNDREGTDVEDDGEDIDNDDEGGEFEGTSGMSRKQRKEHQRNLISHLKALSPAPEVVEAWDVTAPDPLLLVHLKATPNTVSVPPNWRQKRKYLQNKRGMEKRAFQLPAYIVDTGVGELRNAQIEADESKSLKQRQREKMRAKTGRGVEIDHGRLHDAFFKFQTKPRLTGHGDVYYELRELEVDASKFRPGVLSDELRAALGMAEGDPPPWLVNMQRYGPPPGWAGLKVPGVNCPIPKGKRFGFQAGGWGKPPVDESGRPIYGDVFDEGLQYGVRDERFDMSEVEKRVLWGEVEKVTDDEGLRVEAVEEDKEDEREAEKTKQQIERDEGRSTKVRAVTRSREDGVQEGEVVRKGIPAGQLYSVLEERPVAVGESGMMGSSHVYQVRDGNSEGGADKRRREDDGAESKRTPKKAKEFKF